ncbi:MAG: DUF2066 domain-containing protein [Woeseia sp.]
MLNNFMNTPAMRNSKCGISALLLTLLLVTAPVHAVEVEGLYSAEVPVDPNDPDSRETAYERALQQVLIRVTGSEDAAFSPELNALFPNPARYVLQYRPGDDNSLWVMLDGTAIEDVLRRSSMPVWGNDRPLTVLWIAVDWGLGERELLTAAPPQAARTLPGVADRAQSLRDRIQRVARARGVPVVFPTLAPDDESISFSDVWGGFNDRLMDASRAFGSGSILVGRLRADAVERNRWNYTVGTQQRQWTGDAEDAIHLLADSLAGEFAYAGNAGIETVSLSIANVSSAGAFAAVQGLVDSLDMVAAYTVAEVSGNQIRYAIDINGGARRLAAVLDLRAELARATVSTVGPGSEPLRPTATLAYDYRPSAGLRQ